MSAVLTIAGYGFREAVRRKVFAVVVLLTAAFLFLFWLANHYVFTRLSTISRPADVHVDTRTFAGAFLLGLAMFATLFLGVVLAVFLTLGVVTGDAERGLLQPLVVRPVGRSTLLLSRFLGAAAVCIVYVLAVYGIALTIIDVTGHWTPASTVAPGLELAAGSLERAGDLSRETGVLRHERFVRGLGATAALAVQVREDIRRHRLAAHSVCSGRRQRLLDQRLDVVERLVGRPAEQESCAA